ncbi:hypothetical protein IAT40_006247 [Kwoniella sp. CBS 6097]
METPYTRSRKKREKELSSSQSQGQDQDHLEQQIEVDERPSITWLHDQDLRKAVLQATEDDVIQPPTPTQKPRPISSKTEPNSTTRQPPRKRQCRARAHRSLPTSLRRPSGTSGILSINNDYESTSMSETGASGARSLPNVSTGSTLHSTMNSTHGAGGEGEGGRTRLDLLLEKIQILASPPEPPRQRQEKERNSNNKITAVRSEEIGTPSRTLRPREMKMGMSKSGVSSRSGIGMGMVQGSSATRGSTSHITDTVNTPSRTRISSHRNTENDRAQPTYHTSYPDRKDQPCLNPRPSCSKGNLVSSKNTGPTSTRNPLSPVKSSAPRIGLASSQHSKIYNKLPAGPSCNDHDKSKPSNRASGTSTSSATFTRSTSTSTNGNGNGRLFRTPFLNPQPQPRMQSGHGHQPQFHQGIRSSPRRAAAAAAIAGGGPSNMTRSSGSSTSDSVRQRIPSPVRGPAPAPVPIKPSAFAAAAQSRPLIPTKRSSSSSNSGTIASVSAAGSKRPSTPSRGSSSRSSTSAHSLATTHKSGNDYDYEFGDGSTFDLDFGVDVNLDLNLGLGRGGGGGKKGTGNGNGYGGHGEPGSEGDHSFDSFDGIFEEGGEELEMLLRTVDGSE